MSCISVDLPDPETPVMQVIAFLGIVTETFFKLCFVTLERENHSFKGRRFFGRGTFFFPARYAPVREFGSFINCLGEPIAVISPPRLPLPGPKS